MDQNLQLIDKYFQGELDKEELQLFNQKLQEDPAFEQEFRDMKLMHDAVKETSRIKALDIIMNAEANLSTQETTKINVSMKRLVSIAASLLIIATVSYFALSERTGALSGEEIVATYYEPYVNIVNGGVRGSIDEDIITLSARAYNAYDVRDYSTSAELFKELLSAEKTAANYLYSGIANFEAGNLDIAKNNLNTVMNNFTELKEQAQWFLAMTLFKDGSSEEAISNVANLAARGSRGQFSNNAKRVLKDLGLSLTDTETSTGSVIDEEQHPEGSTLPDGSSLGQRRYQTGIISSLTDRKNYRFFNEIPMEDLKEGDLVEFIVLNTGNSSKSMAIILQNLQ